MRDEPCSLFLNRTVEFEEKNQWCSWHFVTQVAFDKQQHGSFLTYKQTASNLTTANNYEACGKGK